MIRLIAFFFLFLPFSSFAQDKIQRPKLVVGIVIDQMRQEYLYRFYSHYGEDGFKRIMKDGYQFENAHYNYVPTATGPGHASIYTGTTPRVHGIIENYWYDKFLKREVYCAEDTDVVGIGGTPDNGVRSPKNLLSTTMTDELKLFFLSQSKVISLSIKDRGAILPAGHMSNGAFWYDDKTGNFMTSSFYMSKLPSWVNNFNQLERPLHYLKGTWETLKPIETYVESDSDSSPFEKALGGKTDPVFPYDIKKLTKSKKPNGLLASTPFGNTVLMELATAAIEGEKLGTDDITDFLAISFSSTDYIGHDYGPFSKEVQDTYIRLDRDLAQLFENLDKKVGIGQWTLFLTADHGVADIPNYLKSKQYGTDYVDGAKLLPNVKAVLKEKYKIDSLIEYQLDGMIYLDRKVIEQNDLELDQIKRFIIDHLERQEGIAGAFDAALIRAYNGEQHDVKLLASGLNARRSGDVCAIVRPGWLWDYYAEKGTGHGSHYSYDTHVPMIFYGWGIKKGKSVSYQEITNIAPTITNLLKIKFPSGCTGQPIVEILD